MKISKCCGAGFPEPGYPDTDLCGLCYEHTEAIDEDTMQEDEILIYETEHEFRPREKSSKHKGETTRLSDYKKTYRETGDHKLAIRSYCRGNKWLEENAKAVGNW